MLQSPSTSAPAIATVADGVDKTRKVRRKRKADTQDNERLSKRLSLLNLGMFLFHLSFFSLICAILSSFKPATNAHITYRAEWQQTLCPR
jgi:hypothetical protein